MNSYKYTKQTTVSSYATKGEKRLAFLLVFVLLVAVIVLGVLYAGASRYQTLAEQQLLKRINSATIDAIEHVNRLTGGVQSNSASRLALVRQQVYYIDQLNDMSIAIKGEQGRLVPDSAIVLLYDDIDTYERLLQTATSSTLDIRTTLLTHLTALQETLRTGRTDQ